MGTLNEKINQIESGITVKFTNYNEGLEGKFTVDRITEKAIQIDGDWYPKSQITDFDAITNEIGFNSWFAKKKTDEQWANRRGGAY